MALEKLVSSKLLKKDANKRIATVDRHVGAVCVATETSMDDTVLPKGGLTEA